MANKILLAFLLFLCSCRTTVPHKAAQQYDNAAATPMACNIKGIITGIMPVTAADSGSICSRYPCRAKVKILGVYGCGSSVSLPVHTDDTLEMQFAYTLHSTEIIPNMTDYFPGLAQGGLFTAQIEQRMQMGTGGFFVVYGYNIVK